MNNVILIGRLTKDPELRYTPNTQTAVARFTLAIDRPVTSGQERQADFIRITVFGKQAEAVDRYLKKGSQAAISGRIQTGSYQDDTGQTVYTTDVIANRVEFLGSRSNNDGESSRAASGNNSRQSGQQQRARAPEQVSFGDKESFPDAFQAVDDDIPF